MKIGKNFLEDLNQHVLNKKNEHLEIIRTYKNKHQPLIEVKEIAQIYTKKKIDTIIFQDLSFDIYEGDRLVIMGANGCGKTTIVEIISGFKNPTKGEVIKNFPEDLPSNKQIGVQFQDLSFPKSLTVYDILKFSAEIDASELIEEEMFEMLEVFQLKDIMNRKVSKLSGGQQQRLNVLLSLITKPRVLFLDEFTTGLDIAVRNNIKDFIMKFCDKYKITLVLISHDIDIMNEMANRVIVIYNKNISIDMSMEQVNKKFGSFHNLVNKYIK